MSATRGRRLVLFAATAIALVLVWPALSSVYREAGDVVHLSPWWLSAIVAAVAIQLLANIELHRIVLGTSKWFDVAAPLLAGNSISHLAPGGNAIGAGVQVRMMTTADFPLTRIVTALGAVTMLGAVSGFVVMPLIVLVGSAAGSDVQPRLIGAMWLGAGVLIAALVGVILIARRDRPWQVMARLATRVQRFFRRPSNEASLEKRLLHDRDTVAEILRGRAARVLLLDLARAFGDYVALYCALRAVGAPVNPAAALAAFIVSNIAGMIPLTPGGLGFVEAGLAGVLTIAGASNAQANLSVAAYRMAATWLPCVAGLIAYGFFARRHARSSARLVS